MIYIAYTDLNKVCSKDIYLLRIDLLINMMIGFRVLLFIDAFLGYNQIKMAQKMKKRLASTPQLASTTTKSCHLG